MLKNISIRARLIFVIAFLSIAMVFIGSIGLISLNNTNASLRTVYEDRVVALGQLDRVIRLINRNQLNVAKAVTDKPEKLGMYVKEIENAAQEAEQVLAAYAATMMTPEEKILFQQFAEARKAFAEEALNPAVAALRANNTMLASDILHGQMEQLYKKVREPMNALIKLQLDVARSEFEQSQKDYRLFRNFSIGLISLGVLLGAGIGYWLVIGISRPLNYAVSIAQDIADGNLTRDVEVSSNDETGKLLQALKGMNESLGKIVGEVRASTDTIATASNEIASGNLEEAAAAAQSMQDQAGTLTQSVSVFKVKRGAATVIPLAVAVSAPKAFTPARPAISRKASGSGRVSAGLIRYGTDDASWEAF